MERRVPALETEQAIQLALVDDAESAVEMSTSDREPQHESGLDRLSRREREVTRLLAQGLTYREISGALSISERTVGSHVEHVMTKLGIRSRTRVAVWAVEHGLGAHPNG